MCVVPSGILRGKEDESTLRAPTQSRNGEKKTRRNRSAELIRLFSPAVARNYFFRAKASINLWSERKAKPKRPVPGKVPTAPPVSPLAWIVKVDLEIVKKSRGGGKGMFRELPRSHNATTIPRLFSSEFYSFFFREFFLYTKMKPSSLAKGCQRLRPSFVRWPVEKKLSHQITQLRQQQLSPSSFLLSQKAPSILLIRLWLPLPLAIYLFRDSQRKRKPLGKKLAQI